MPALNLHPRLVYLADTAACLVLGAILIVAAPALTTLLGWTLPPALLIVLGVILLPWAAFNLMTARVPRLTPAILATHVTGDALWVAGSVALAAIHAGQMGQLGLFLLLGQAVAVAGMLLLKLAFARPFFNPA
ncbi:hypothetical protein FF80_00801 [Devosia sp. LC5]|uniref:hypothetical protein n=1 Tax=Devosia sp. LC5 TaxID=1502724 RepID=UPI0004E3AACB|nr:hypothetical protein [Devosia sp. LC5]KFC71082.1 hypothetical protein FF80_00801 [Devosia sp. LC5]